MDALVNGYQSMLSACKITNKTDGSLKDETMVSVDDLILTVQTQNLVIPFFDFSFLDRKKKQKQKKN